MGSELGVLTKLRNVWTFVQHRYITHILWCCEDYVLWTNMQGQRCEKDIVRKTSRVKHCERRKRNIMYMYIGISKDNVGRMILWGKTLWELCCENEIVSITLWGWWCEKKIVSMTLWERSDDKDVVRKTL